MIRLATDEEEMPTPSPRLDALIPREDFEVDGAGTDQDLQDFVDITSLEKRHFFYESLRKPDFQRETGNWSPWLVNTTSIQLR